MQTLVDGPFDHKRLEQRDCLLGVTIAHQAIGDIGDQSGPDCVQPIAVSHCPVFVEVLGEQLAPPESKRPAEVGELRGLGRCRYRGVELIDVDRQAAVAAEPDDLVLEDEMFNAQYLAGGVERLGEGCTPPRPDPPLASVPR